MSITADEINRGLHREVRTGALYGAFMPPSDCSSTKLGNGDTSFAIQNMAKTARKYQHHTRDLTLKFFSGMPIEKLCNDIHQFLYWHFQYSIDGDKQLLRSPACSWLSRFDGIDCKSYSIFASTILLNAGIKHYMRRIKQAMNPDGFTHVYVVVPKNQKTANLTQGYYVIDGTINTMKELPYLEKDDVLVNENKGLAAPQVANHINKAFKLNLNISTQYNAWETFSKTIENFEKLSPNNPDVKRLKKDVYTALKNKAYNLDIQLKGFTILFNGKEYNLINIPPVEGLGAVTVNELAQMTADDADRYIEMQAQAIKAQTASIVDSVASTASSIASLFGPIGQLIGVCIQALGLIVSLFVMFVWNPCAHVTYVPDEIRRKLQTEFAPMFEQTAREIEEHFKYGTFVSSQHNMNRLLKEIDLGFEHFQAEKHRLKSDKCSIAAIIGFDKFVNNIKAVTDSLYIGLKTMLNHHFKFTEIKVWGSTKERSWYFIVPTTSNEIRAQYRKVSIARWNENLKTMYPYADERSFETWLNTNVIYLNTLYNDQRGDRYRQEMLPFSSKIKALRENLNLNVTLRWDAEEALRKEQYAIYLRYDTDYKASLEKDAKNEMEAYRMLNQSFIDELNKIKKEKIIDEQRRLDNVMKIAQDKERRLSNYEKNKLINILCIGAIGLLSIKMIQKS